MQRVLVRPLLGMLLPSLGPSPSSSLSLLSPAPTCHSILTVQAGLTHSLVGSARLGHTFTQVAGFAALPAVGVPACEACLFGTSEGHLWGDQKVRLAREGRRVSSELLSILS